MTRSASSLAAIPGGDLLARYAIGEVVEWKVLEGGMFLKPVLVVTQAGRYVLRAHSFRPSEECFRFQAETLEQLAHVGIRCPRVIRDCSGHWGEQRLTVFWALHEYLDGRSYSWREWSAMKSDLGFVKELGSRVGTIHDCLAIVEPSGFEALPTQLPPIQFASIQEIRRQWRDDLDRLKTCSLFAHESANALLANRSEIEDYWAAVEQAVKDLLILELPRQLVHGDVSAVNMVFQGGRSEFALIDWDCLHCGFRVYDALGDLLNRPPTELAGSSDFNLLEVQRYLNGYQNGTGRPLSSDEVRCVPAFCLARQLEDLRQRLSLLPSLQPAKDAEYATLIRGRVRMMRSISQSTHKLAEII